MNAVVYGQIQFSIKDFSSSVDMLKLHNLRENNAEAQ